MRQLDHRDGGHGPHPHQLRDRPRRERELDGDVESRRKSGQDAARNDSDSDHGARRLQRHGCPCFDRCAIRRCIHQIPLDGGPTQTYDPSNQPTSNTQGNHALDYWSADNADNVEAHHTLSATINTVAPSISVAQTPQPNVNGWNNTDVTVSFTCSDAVSGVRSCPSPVTVSTEGASQPVSGTAFDNADNSASANTPWIEQDRAEHHGDPQPLANSNGWNNTNVTVNFSCSDALSGVAACPPSQTVSTEGAAQSVSGTVFDKAGNSASATVASINVDKTAPVVSVSGVTNGGTYVEGGYSASCSTSDALSGVATSATVSTAGGPTGSVTLTCTGATDRAGNAQAAPVSVQITVTPAGGGGTGFQFGGFLPPVAGNGAVNDVFPGQPVLVRFSLGGYRGMNIFTSGYPASAASNCSGIFTSGLDKINWPWGAPLWYSPRSDTYSFFWFTSPWWQGCRTLVLKFSDGSTQVAYFDFERHSHHENDHDHDQHH